MSLSSMLDKIAVHERQSAVQDAIGGNVPTWATQTASVPCALWPAGSTLTRQFMRRDLIGDHVICCASDIGVLSKDRFTVSGESGYFLVNGFEKFNNSSIGSEVVYAIDVTKRTV